MKRSAPPRHRGRSRFPHRRDDLFRAWVRRRECVVASHGAVVSRCLGATQFAHVQSRGAGGADLGNGLPLCAGHHTEQHTIGIHSFHAKYRLDLGAIATDLAARYLRSAA